jgi:hypothetical protein
MSEKKKAGGPAVLTKQNIVWRHEPRYSSLSVSEGGMNVLSPYSLEPSAESSHRISSSLAKYRFCALDRNLMVRLTHRPDTAQKNSSQRVPN